MCPGLFDDVSSDDGDGHSSPAYDIAEENQPSPEAPEEEDDGIEAESDAEENIDDEAKDTAANDAQEDPAEEARAQSALAALKNEFVNDLVATCNGLRILVSGNRGATIDDHAVHSIKLIQAALTSRNFPLEWRVADWVLLDPPLQLIGSVFVPLWDLATTLEHEEALERLMLIFQRVSQGPSEAMMEQVGPAGVGKFMEYLYAFKLEIARPLFWKGLQKLVGHLRIQAASGGLLPDDLQKLRKVQTRLEELKGETEAPSTNLDVELGVADCEVNKLTDCASRIVKLQRMERLLEKRQREKRLTVQKLFAATKLLVVNIISLTRPWKSVQEDPQLQIVRFLFEFDLHTLFEQEWLLILEAGAWDRMRRVDDRKDANGISLGKDETIIWRCLMFYFHIFRSLSARGSGYMLGKAFLDLERYDIGNKTFGEDINDIGLDNRSVLEASACLARSSKFNPGAQLAWARRNDRVPDWMSRKDRVRVQKQSTVIDVEKGVECWDKGEMAQLAQECLSLRLQPEVGRRAGQDMQRVLRQAASGKFVKHLGDFLGIAFGKLAQGWIADYVQMDVLSAPSVCRLFNTLCWCLHCCREEVENLLRAEEEWKDNETMVGTLEKRLLQLIVAVRVGLEGKTSAVIVGRLKRELKRPAKDRSQSMMRVCLRLIVEQLDWGLMLTKRSHRAVLVNIGKAIFEDYARKGLPSLLVMMARDFTSYRAERQFFLLVITAMTQLLEASGVRGPQLLQKNRKKGPSGRTIHYRGGVKVGESGSDNALDPKENNIITGALSDSAVLTKLLNLLTLDQPPNTLHSILTLLTTLSQHEWPALLLGWQLQYVNVFQNIMQPTSEFQCLQPLLLKSIAGLAELFRTNKFVLIEPLFSQLLLRMRKDESGIFTNYELVGRARAQGPREPWAKRDEIKLLHIYETHRLEGVHAVLRQLRRELNRSVDDISDKVVKMKLVDSYDAGVMDIPSMVLRHFKEVQMEWSKQAAIAAAMNALLEILGDHGPTFLREVYVHDQPPSQALLDAVSACYEAHEGLIAAGWTKRGNQVEFLNLVVDGSGPRAIVSEDDIGAACDLIVNVNSLLLQREKNTLTDETAADYCLRLLIWALRTHVTNGPVSEPLLKRLQEVALKEIQRRKRILLGIFSDIQRDDPPSIEGLTPLGQAFWRTVLTFTGFFVDGDPVDGYPLLTLEQRVRRVRALVRMDLTDLSTVAKSAMSKSKKADKKTIHYPKHLTAKEIARAADMSRSFRVSLRNMIAPTMFTNTLLSLLNNLERWCRRRLTPGITIHSDFVLTSEMDEDEGGDVPSEAEVTANGEAEGPNQQTGVDDSVDSKYSIDTLLGVTMEDFCAAKVPSAEGDEANDKFAFPIGPLSEFVDYQRCLHQLGGSPDSSIQPKRWTWYAQEHSPYKVVKVCWIYRAVLLNAHEPPADIKRRLKDAKKEGTTWLELIKCLKEAVPSGADGRRGSPDGGSDGDSLGGGEDDQDIDEALFGETNAELDAETAPAEVPTGRATDVPGLAQRLRRRVSMPTDAEILMGGQRFMDEDFMGENIPPSNRARDMGEENDEQIPEELIEEEEEYLTETADEEVMAPDVTAMNATEHFIWELDEDDEAMAGALLGL